MFQGGDHKIIRTLEWMKSLFSQIKFLNYQTLQKKGISRDCWKWILKFHKINIIQEKIIFYCKTNLRD